MSVIEKINMFFYTLVLCASNRKFQERFEHFGETVIRHFNAVLRFVCSLAMEIIKPPDLEFSSTP
jgi:hypothetical protein